MVLHAINQLKPRSTILDGEIVALDAEGIPRFQLLQHDEWSFQPSDFNRKGSWTKVVQSFVIRDATRSFRVLVFQRLAAVIWLLAMKHSRHRRSLV